MNSFLRVEHYFRLGLYSLSSPFGCKEGNGNGKEKISIVMPSLLGSCDGNAGGDCGLRPEVLQGVLKCAVT